MLSGKLTSFFNKKTSDRRIRKVSPRINSQLWQYLQSAWREISLGTLEKLINKMLKICKTIIETKEKLFDNKKL